jgi:predicted nucleic acid-binding protein
LSSTSTSGAVGSVLAVDANILISALRRGKAMRLLTSPRLVFLTTIRTTWEVERYLPTLASELSARAVVVDHVQLRERFHSLPLVALPESFYSALLPEARRLIERRDPTDADILALTLRVSVPLWTNDHHFDGIAEIRTVTTAELLALLGL